MNTPLVSIVIPVGPDHAAHVSTAVASCRWQTLPDWEALVVNDTGRPLASRGDDRVTVIDAPATTGKRRASVARNAGIAAARGTFTVFLDADDYLLPSAITTFVRGHARHEKAYSFSHHYGVNRFGEWAQYRPPDYNRELQAGPHAHSTGGPNPVPTMQGCNLHPITAFVPTWCLREVGGFDEDAPAFEDWTIWLRLAMAGWCGARIFGPTFVYRRDEGVLHLADMRGGQATMDAVTAPYRDRTGVIPMAGCGCGGGAKAAKDMAQQLAQTFGVDVASDTGLVTLEFTGTQQGKQNFRHPASRREYRAGASPASRYIQVPPEDVPYLTGLGFFARVAPLAPFVPPPSVVAPETVAEGHAPKPIKREKVAA